MKHTAAVIQRSLQVGNRVVRVSEEEDVGIALILCFSWRNRRGVPSVSVERSPRGSRGLLKGSNGRCRHLFQDRFEIGGGRRTAPPLRFRCSPSFDFLFDAGSQNGPERPWGSTVCLVGAMCNDEK